MRVHLGSDHAGFELKQHLAERLGASTGTRSSTTARSSTTPSDDYPPYCLRAAAAAVGEPGSLGVVIGGSGNGEQIAANKVRGVRAALAWSVETARLARQHNNANVVAVGARMHTAEEASSFVEAFLATPFSARPPRAPDRDARRLRGHRRPAAAAGRATEQPAPSGRVRSPSAPDA